MQFFPIFNIGGMNLDHDFVQVTITFFSRIQVKTIKKKVFTKNKTTFFPNSSLHPKWNAFFPWIQVDTYAQMHTRIKLLRGMQI